MHPIRRLPLAAVLTVVLATTVHAADKPIKTSILAGQSNMVGYGDSTKLPDDLREGNDRVLMFENGKWQPLRPHKPAIPGQRRLGLTEFSFGPEIAFGHAMAEALPEETIGIIKHAAGSTSLLAWKPDWTKEDAARVGQVGRGPLYKFMMRKIRRAQAQRDIEIVGFLWLIALISVLLMVPCVMRLVLSISQRSCHLTRVSIGRQTEAELGPDLRRRLQSVHREEACDVADFIEHFVEHFLGLELRPRT